MKNLLISLMFVLLFVVGSCGEENDGKTEKKYGNVTALRPDRLIRGFTHLQQDHNRKPIGSQMYCSFRSRVCMVLKLTVRHSFVGAETDFCCGRSIAR